MCTENMCLKCVCVCGEGGVGVLQKQYNSQVNKKSSKSKNQYRIPTKLKIHRLNL